MSIYRPHHTYDPGDVLDAAVYANPQGQKPDTEHLTTWHPVFNGASKKLVGYYKHEGNEWREPIGREKFFTLDNYKR